MKKMQLLFTAALMLGLSSFAFAGTPKGEDKGAKATETPTVSETTTTGSVKWFHFNGTAGQESDASLYSEELAPECPDNEQEYRCDIKIMSQGTTPDRPDLATSTVQEERTRSNP